MIRLKQLGPNKTVLFVKGNELFFSYQTLVGVQDGSKLMITNHSWSNTTSKHINQWLSEWDYKKTDKEVLKIDQEELEKYLNI